MNDRRGVCQPGAVGMCASATEPASHWLDAQVLPASPVSHLAGDISHSADFPSSPVGPGPVLPLARCFQLRPAMESNPGRTGWEGPESQFYSHSLVLGPGHFSPRVMRL